MIDTLAIFECNYWPLAILQPHFHGANFFCRHLLKFIYWRLCEGARININHKLIRKKVFLCASLKKKESSGWGLGWGSFHICLPNAELKTIFRKKKASNAKCKICGLHMTNVNMSRVCKLYTRGPYIFTNVTQILHASTKTSKKALEKIMTCVAHEKFSTARAAWRGWHCGWAGGAPLQGMHQWQATRDTCEVWQGLSMYRP